MLSTVAHIRPYRSRLYPNPQPRVACQTPRNVPRWGEHITGRFRLDSHEDIVVTFLRLTQEKNDKTYTQIQAAKRAREIGQKLRSGEMANDLWEGVQTVTKILLFIY